MCSLFSFDIFCITLLLMSSVYFDFQVLILFLVCFYLNEGTKRWEGREEVRGKEARDIERKREREQRKRDNWVIQ